MDLHELSYYQKIEREDNLERQQKGERRAPALQYMSLRAHVL
jgi:hypothetical protein